MISSRRDRLIGRTLDIHAMYHLCISCLRVYSTDIFGDAICFLAILLPNYRRPCAESASLLGRANRLHDEHLDVICPCSKPFRVNFGSTSPHLPTQWRLWIYTVPLLDYKRRPWFHIDAREGDHEGEVAQCTLSLADLVDQVA